MTGWPLAILLGAPVLLALLLSLYCHRGKERK